MSNDQGLLSRLRIGTNYTGFPFTAVALLLCVGTAVAISASASESQLFVNQLVGFGVILYALFLVLGSGRWLASSSVPMVAAIVLEAGFGDNASWVRSVVVGCLWFVAMEAGWEAIDRRDGATRTAAANARRAQDVLSVVAVSLLLGVVAAAAASFAPVRSVLLQAVLIGGLLAALVTLVRHLVPAPTLDDS